MIDLIQETISILKLRIFLQGEFLGKDEFLALPRAPKNKELWQIQGEYRLRCEACLASESSMKKSVPTGSLWWFFTAVENLSHFESSHIICKSAIYHMVNNWRVLSGWWFGSWILWLSIGNVIIPSDELICFRGFKPPTSYVDLAHEQTSHRCVVKLIGNCKWQKSNPRRLNTP